MPSATKKKSERETKGEKKNPNSLKFDIELKEKRFNLIVPILTYSMLALMVVVIILGGNFWDETTEIPIIGLPLSVLLWAYIGSMGAILYHFHKLDVFKIKKGPRAEVWFTEEVRYLVSRPVIGMIMGSLVYMGLTSGLILFGASITSENSTREILYVVAFLGGFSDKFYERFIALVVGKLGARQADDEETEENTRPPMESIEKQPANKLNDIAPAPAPVPEDFSQKTADHVEDKKVTGKSAKTPQAKKSAQPAEKPASKRAAGAEKTGGG